MARSLGLDVGNRRIGVAVSDMSKVIARPIEIIDRKRQDAMERIAMHVRDQLADEIVIGYPCNADGSIGLQARAVEQFVELLRSRISITVTLYDERFSTSEAREIIAARRHKDRSAHDDDVAAAVILQRYLDEHHEHRMDFDDAGRAGPSETDVLPDSD